MKFVLLLSSTVPLATYAIHQMEINQMKVTIFSPMRDSDGEEERKIISGMNLNILLMEDDVFLREK